MDIEKIRRYVEIDRERRDLAAKDDILKAEKARLEPQIQEMFAQSGVQNMNVDGMTVYLHRRITAGLNDGYSRADGALALDRAGLEELTGPNFNTTSVASYFGEMEKNGEALDPDLMEVFKKGEVYTVRVKQ